MKHLVLIFNMKRTQEYKEKSKQYSEKLGEVLEQVLEGVDKESNLWWSAYLHSKARVSAKFFESEESLKYYN